MHDKPSGAGDDGRASTTAQDLHDQGVVLIQVLALHPACLTVSELVREVTGGSCDCEPGDRFERAVRDLTGAGLLHACAGFVMPTRAALVFDQLLRG
ncbi:MAG TPA: hypothetical protein VFX85_12970 [Solirubrobacterales bacterium]|nr:hypothetical protein [Solirubrobacterales bacterium]